MLSFLIKIIPSQYFSPSPWNPLLQTHLVLINVAFSLQLIGFTVVVVFVVDKIVEVIVVVEEEVVVIVVVDKAVKLIDWVELSQLSFFKGLLNFDKFNFCSLVFKSSWAKIKILSIQV